MQENLWYLNKIYWYKMIYISKEIWVMLRHFKKNFFRVYFVYQNLFIVFNAYLKSLIKKVSMSLGCTYYYILLFIKKIVVNITDFPAPFKIYKKIFIDSHVKISDRNYWYACFCKKLVKFLQGVYTLFDVWTTSKTQSRALLITCCTVHISTILNCGQCNENAFLGRIK